jgi:Uma2 family endonuclease
VEDIPMATPTSVTPLAGMATLPPILDDIPIVYEDEDEGDMGESNEHVDADEIVHVCVGAFLRRSGKGYRVFSNMNLYYREGPLHEGTGSAPYVSPDSMVVQPYTDLGDKVPSYSIGRDGPPPVTVAEILSKRSAQQQDLGKKLVIYAKLGIAEYILVDETGRFLKQRLQVRRLQPDRTWIEEQDADGGITSQLGFRLIWDTDHRLRLLDVTTGERYLRPDEAQAEADARRLAEQRLQAEADARRIAEKRVRALEAELLRQREDQGPRP